MAIVDQFDFEGVEALRVGRFKHKINLSCILYRIEDTLIDTGPANQWRFVRPFLSERDIKQVYLTHHHEDHSGNCGRICKKWAPKVYAHESGADFNQKGFSVPLYRRFVFGKPKKFASEPIPEVFQAGALKLRSIPCPGHAPDLVTFLEPNRGWLFTGDLFVSAQPKMARLDEDPNEEIKSLENLLTYQFDTLFCAHRGIVVDGYDAMRRKLKYLVALREQVGYYFQQGDTVPEIFRRVFGKEQIARWVSFCEISSRNYVTHFVRHARRLKYEEATPVEESL